MNPFAIQRNQSTNRYSRRSCVSWFHLVFATVVFGISAASWLEPSRGIAQDWVPRNAIRPENTEPLLAPPPPATSAPAHSQLMPPSHGPKWPGTPGSGPTHLVIQAPQPLKNHRHASHEPPQIAVPTRPETVGGGYWNQEDSLHGQVISSDEVMVDDQFGGEEMAQPVQPKKKIDLTHHIPSHMHKTPRPTAIPQASRTTGWKQPYSYGHFGAKHNRQLSIHHGHQRAYTQWTFR